MKKNIKKSLFDEISFVSPFFDLGNDFYDPVPPGNFQNLQLRWYNQEVLTQLGATPDSINEKELVDAFGAFTPIPSRVHPPVAQRYIGYQFQVFNPNLGDGRGFLLAQVLAKNKKILDLGTKGSGTTPYSRGGDGHLTLKGGIRELIAAEFLHAMGVKTSRPLSLVEHDAKLWRGDEPSPTRASILVRVGESHVRFGTFERLYYLVRDSKKKKALLCLLADHVIDNYYPALSGISEPEERYTLLYRQIVQRTAAVVAAWIRAGFCHGVLNTDNMNITGDSFDYGPFAFLEDYDPRFTAAYFDHHGLYAFEAQPDACYWNLAMLARPFGEIAPEGEILREREKFSGNYRDALRKALLPRLGFLDQESQACNDLIAGTLKLFRKATPHYHKFFQSLTEDIAHNGITEKSPQIPSLMCPILDNEIQEMVQGWRFAWQTRLMQEAKEQRSQIKQRLQENNPIVIPYRSEIERVWKAIDEKDDWEPFQSWMTQLQNPFEKNEA